MHGIASAVSVGAGSSLVKRRTVETSIVCRIRRPGVSSELAATVYSATIPRIAGRSLEGQLRRWTSRENKELQMAIVNSANENGCRTRQ